MTVPVRSANKSARSPSRRPPTLSIATWILAPSAAALTRPFQPATSVAKTGAPGKIPVSFAALASLRTSLNDFHAPLRQDLADEAPDCGSCASEQRDDPGTRVRGKGILCRADHCETRN